MHIELPEHSVSKHEPKSFGNKPPTILKKETRILEPTTAVPNEDVEMGNGTVDRLRVHKPADTAKESMTPKDKGKAKLDNMAIHDKNDQNKARVSPAYWFASELQENMDVEVLFKSLMSQEIPVKLGDIFGSSFELCKRLQISTKMQRVPVHPKAVRTKNVELLISSAEYGFNLWTRPPLINQPSKDSRAVYKVLIHSDDETSDENSSTDDSGSELDTDNQGTFLSRYSTTIIGKPMDLTGRSAVTQNVPESVPERECSLKKLRPRVEALTILNQVPEPTGIDKALHGHNLNSNSYRPEDDYHVIEETQISMADNARSKTGRLTLTYNSKHCHPTFRRPIIAYQPSEKSMLLLESRALHVKCLELGLILVFDPRSIELSILQKNLVKTQEGNLTALHLPTYIYASTYLIRYKSKLMTQMISCPLETL
jgi:Protein of unknown function (DUF4100)